MVYFCPKSPSENVTETKMPPTCRCGSAQHITTGGLNIRTSGGAVQKYLKKKMKNCVPEICLKENDIFPYY